MKDASYLAGLPAVIALDDDTRIATRSATPGQLEQAAAYMTEQAAMKIADDIECARSLRGLAYRRRGTEGPAA